MYRGTGHGFVDYTMGAHQHLEAHLHRLTTVTVEVHGEVAGSEGYVDSRFRLIHEGQAVELTSCGRFVDRWEKRGGTWAIADRRYLHEMDTATPVDGSRFARSGRCDATDPSYAVLPGRVGGG